MTPYFAGPGLTVWNCDALDAYRQYADNAFGLLWLDPPYNHPYVYGMNPKTQNFKVVSDLRNTHSRLPASL